jgi:serine protease
MFFWAEAPTMSIIMKKIILSLLFIFGLVFAILNFQGLANQGEFESIVVNFREDVNVTENLSFLNNNFAIQPRLNSEFSEQDHVYIFEGNRQLLKSLRNSPLKRAMEYIEPNYIYHSFDIPNDPLYTQQWNLHNINITPAWEETKGEGVTVAVIDTGVTQVPDLKETKIVPGYDFVNDKIDAIDDVGHGTHVAGTIAQSTNNNYGVAGIAYQAQIMPIKVLAASGGGTIADIAEGIRFATDNGADVINMSLGGGGASKLLEDAINYAYEKGVIIVAAAGNANQNSASYPARYPRVISVSALDALGEKAPYSNFGAGVDISAPGGSESGKILQNTINHSTGESIFEGYQGTSMAAPHVAGVAALIKATGVNNPDEILSILKQSARPINNDTFNYFGAGHLDAGEAVKLALKGQITFKDFFRWLRDNGYLNPKFWIDGGVVALFPKVAMVLGSYLLAFILRNYLPFNLSLNMGLVAGSSGLFFLRGFYIFDLPQWPFRVMGSSLPELGNSLNGSGMLNPIFASVLIPFLLIVLLLGNYSGKWFSVGVSLGVTSCLLITALIHPSVWGLGSGLIASGFLIFNAILCFGLANFVSRSEKFS